VSFLPPVFNCGRFEFTLNRPLLMGIVNVTPDSFSDGGLFNQATAAIEHGLRLREEGADILDIGGESTRPGAAPVSLQEELDRVMPVLEGLKDCGAALSVDTLKPQVMAAVLAAGADMINDVNALRAEASLAAVASSHCGLCLMHMQGTPGTMQAAPQYENVVAEVGHFLQQRVMACQAAGIDASRLLIDPGFGFGKTLQHNIFLFKKLAAFADTAPVLVGVSRKSMIGMITGQKTASDRLAGSVMAAVMAASQGAAVLRVHDVRATADALRIWQALGAEQ
jgi:dihydropteroate synthase